MPQTSPVLYLHIGAGKAGSSAIQTALRDNRKALRGNGILVATSDLSASGRVDGAQVSFFEGLLPVTEESETLVTQRLDVLHREARKRGLRGVVLSAENLCNTDEFARLFAGAQSQFDVRVLLYIRRQDDYAIAAWNQWYFKLNNDFGQWADSIKGRLANWADIIERWEKRLPGARFCVRRFDRSAFPRASVVYDFLTLLDIDYDRLGIADNLANPTLNEIAMRVAFRNRRLVKDAQDHSFLEFLKSLGGDAAFTPLATGLYFTADERAAFMAAYTDSNERVKQRWFPTPAAGTLFPDATFGSTGVTSEQAAEAERDLLWTVLFNMWRERTARR